MVDCKKAEELTLKLTPYTASIDRSLLKYLVCMRSFDEIAPDATAETLTSETIKIYLKSQTNNKNEIQNLSLVGEAMAGLKFPTSIRYPIACITTYFAEMLEHLNPMGCRVFKIEKPKHTIKLLLDRLRPPPLKSPMKYRLKLEAGLQNGVGLFVNRLKAVAKGLQAIG